MKSLDSNGDNSCVNKMQMNPRRCPRIVRLRNLFIQMLNVSWLFSLISFMDLWWFAIHVSVAIVNSRFTSLLNEEQQIKENFMVSLNRNWGTFLKLIDLVSWALFGGLQSP